MIYLDESKDRFFPRAPGMVDIVVHLVGTRRVKLESFREAVAQALIE